MTKVWQHQGTQRHERTCGTTLGCVDVDYPSATVDGFELGMFVPYDDCGDAWVKAPDRSVATLIWETGTMAFDRFLAGFPYWHRLELGR